MPGKQDLLRETFVRRLHEDLIGPGAEDEVIVDRPTDRYLTGILFPRGSKLPQEEDEALAVEEADESSEIGPVDNGVPLAASFRPASMGLSFCVAGKKPAINVEISLATYLCRWVKSADKHAASHGSNPAEELTDQQGDRKSERWVRHPHQATLSNILVDGNSPVEIDLQKHGLPAGAQLYIQTADIQGGIGVTAVLVNNNLEGADRRGDTERTFFQTRLRITAASGSSLQPRPHRPSWSHVDNSEDEDSGELIYRHVKEYSVGHTCSASWQGGQESPADSVTTEWIPRYNVPATSPAGDSVFEALRRNKKLQPLSASWLASASQKDLVAGLTLLPASYQAWIADQEQNVSTLPDRFRMVGERHVQQWRAACDRMLQAVELIGSDADVRLAFQSANEAMQMQRGWGTEGAQLTWRPFQLGFQLLVLASLVRRDDPNHDVMDLLWFPTGGGKTEAYLGVIAFTLFLRRLRHRKPKKGESDGGGVAVIMRYTLRLLTTQQFERAARLTCVCETLRRTSGHDFGATPISIGLWVGGAATANKVADAHGDLKRSSLQIANCPCCGAKVRCPNDSSKYAIYCENHGACGLAQEGVPLPIWTVDEDIYRELPSLLIGTIDKFAQIVRKPETAKFFGVNTTHDSPELILQDELHLITGPLGTIAGLYEIAIDELCAAGGGRPKIIGSTATIRRAADQVRALFNRRVYQFPAPGLHADNSCFAVRDYSKEGRLYLGVTTAGRSPKFALQAVTASLLQSSESPESASDHDDDYWTLVTYFNSLRELGGAHVLMLDDVPKSISEYAQRRSETSRKLGEPVELSSNLNQAEIPQVLRSLALSRNEGGAIDSALATNMISVGMDIPRLALMIVNGQPKTIAEYIQATSRVGRDAVPGLVVSVFNVNKPRDRSHYETFCSWHGTLYRDVEATSVTPFAPRAQDKALHAVLVALVRHMVGGMSASPVLSQASRNDCASIELAIAGRASAIDLIDGATVPRKLTSLLDHWEQRGAISKYWNDRSYQANPPLLMSAETHAALKAVGRDRQDIWPTMNSMREVEPTCIFRLAEVLKVTADPMAEATGNDSEEGGNDAEQ